MDIKGALSEGMVNVMPFQKQISVAFGIVGAFVSFTTELLGLAITSLMAIMLLELISDILVRISEERFNCKGFMHEVVIKFYYIIMLSATSLLNLIVPFVENAVTGLAISLAVLEFASMVSNGRKLNVNIPFLDNILDILKSRNGGK